jgi:superfamily II DNA helicase RecQ
MQDSTKDLGLKAICEQAAASLGYSQLKHEQLEAMMEFVSGKDVFVVLPTGFGEFDICQHATCV